MGRSGLNADIVKMTRLTHCDIARLRKSLRVRPKILSHISKSYNRCGTKIFAEFGNFLIPPAFLWQQLFDKTRLVSNRTLNPFREDVSPVILTSG